VTVTVKLLTQAESGGCKEGARITVSSCIFTLSLALSSDVAAVLLQGDWRSSALSNLLGNATIHGSAAFVYGGRAVNGEDRLRFTVRGFSRRDLGMGVTAFLCPPSLVR